MRLLMVTRADDKVKEISNLTHPIMRAFAKRWNSDFLTLSENADCNDEWGRIHYRIMKVYDLLEKYDRVMNIDSDVIINKNCPNLFGIVPYDRIGVVFEDKGTRQRNRRQRIIKIQAAWGDIGWRKDYVNTGVCLVSRLHRAMFRRFEGRYWENQGYTDVHLGYQIQRLGFKIFELDWRFNHMSIFSEVWNGNASRFNSYIIHYAGKGRFPDKGNQTLEQLIKGDIARIYE